ncbi:MAG: replicative DNA helicase [Patescibacteria group bacterium]
MTEVISKMSKTSLRIPPHDLEAEQALLGSIMIRPYGLNEVADYVHANDFYAEKHRLIYQAMMTLFEKSEPIDLVSVTTVLRENKALDRVGGSSYLVELNGAVPSAANLKHYADIVAKKSSLRRLIDSAEQILELGYKENEELDTTFDKAEKLVFNLANFTKKAFVSIKDELKEAWERFDHLRESDTGIRGVPSGFKELDNKLSGFQKSDLIILAARPSMGKTSLALDIVRHVACRENIPTLIFSLEMSSQQLVDRLLAAESGVDSWRLRTGRINTDEEFSRLQDAMGTLAKAPIYIDDESSNNITKMRSVARKLRGDNGIGLIVVDYLQLMVPRRESDSMVQMVTEISRSLKGLARELEVPVIALSQLNRAVEQRGGKPRLSDLRDSGSIEQDADVVMFIHREDKYNENSEKKNIAQILIEKHRNGPTGSLELFFDEQKVSFLSVDKSDFGAF